MLIERADLGGTTPMSMRLAHGHVTAVAAQLTALDGEEVFDAAGAAVLPGLHDHHIHLLALAAALDSVRCGPPEHRSADTLATALRGAAAKLDGRWLRGVGYHESVAGDIDRDWIDSIVADVPVRIQHRSGQLWIFNSRALVQLGVDDRAGDDPFERRVGRQTGRLTGRLYGADAWLRQRLGGALPELGRASALLARRGVTGVTDASPGNGPREFEHFREQQQRGHLLQDALVMGSAALDSATAGDGLGVGPTKLHLRESALPAFDELCHAIRCSHDAGRAVAVHCVTLSELVFAVEAVRACGTHPGDRIEHASLCSPEAIALIRSAGLRVVTQPNFVFERGDTYRAELPAEEFGWLYRARSFADAGIALAAGSDAPHGEADPWQALAAAVARRSRDGAVLGAGESLAPAQALALALFGGDPLRPGEASRSLTPGARADLCVLDRSWDEMLQDFASVQVLLTLRRGETIWAA